MKVPFNSIAWDTRFKLDIYNSILQSVVYFTGNLHVQLNYDSRELDHEDNL